MRGLKLDIMSLAALGLSLAGWLIYPVLAPVSSWLTPLLARGPFRRAWGWTRPAYDDASAGWPGLSADPY